MARRGVRGLHSSDVFVIRLHAQQPLSGRGFRVTAVSLLPSPTTRVLLVDRHHDTLDMYGEFLRREGFNVLCCETPDEGLETARRSVPDVVTTEWGLRCRDGAEFCEALRRDGRTRGVPLIVVTAWPAPDTLIEPQRLGCAAVLLKPVLPEVLVEHIRRVLAGRGVRP
jgi:DNA-binding response OmpR family regulator